MQKGRDKNGFFFDSDISSVSSFESLNSFTLSSFSSDELKYGKINNNDDYLDESLLMIDSQLPFLKKINDIQPTTSGYNLRNNKRINYYGNSKYNPSENNFFSTNSNNKINNPIVIDNIEIIDDPEIIVSNTKSSLKRKNMEDNIVESIERVIDDSKESKSNPNLKTKRLKNENYFVKGKKN
jgi:hypothetical protein